MKRRVEVEIVWDKDTVWLDERMCRKVQADVMNAADVTVTRTARSRLLLADAIISAFIKEHLS